MKGKTLWKEHSALIVSILQIKRNKKKKNKHTTNQNLEKAEQHLELDMK